MVLYWYNGHDYTEMWYFSLIYDKKQICGYELQKCNYIHPLFFNFNYVTITNKLYTYNYHKSLSLTLMCGFDSLCQAITLSVKCLVKLLNDGRFMFLFNSYEGMLVT